MRKQNIGSQTPTFTREDKGSWLPAAIIAIQHNSLTGFSYKAASHNNAHMRPGQPLVYKACCQYGAFTLTKMLAPIILILASSTMVLVESAQGYPGSCSRVEWKTRTFDESWNCVDGICDCTRKTRTCSHTGVETVVDGSRHFGADDHSFEENSSESVESSEESNHSNESPESDESDESASDEPDESVEGSDWDCR